MLEELPKWKLLGDVLEEIETEIAYGPEIDLSRYSPRIPSVVELTLLN